MQTTTNNDDYEHVLLKKEKSSFVEKMYAWLKLPYPERSAKALSDSGLEIDSEGLATIVERALSKLYFAILANYASLAELRDNSSDFLASDAVKNFHLLLPRIKDPAISDECLHLLLLDQAHDLTWWLLHSQQRPSPAALEEAVNEANTFYYDLLPLLWDELAWVLKRDFCLTAAQLFDDNGYYREALSYYIQAFILTLANSAYFNDTVLDNLHQRLLRLEQRVLQQVHQDYFKNLAALIARSLTKENVLEEWQRHCPQLTALASAGQYGAITLLYATFEPELIKTLHYLDQLDEIKNDGAALAQIYHDLMDHFIQSFAGHGRYQLAETWCEKIEKWFNESSGCTQAVKQLRDDCSERRQYFQRRKKQSLSAERSVLVKAPSRFYEAMVTYRQTLKEGIAYQQPAFTLQKTFSQHCQQLLGQMATHITTSLGEPPCAFSVLGLGSISRKDMCLESDVDAALLLASQNKRQHPYFTAWLRLWHFYLQSLGDGRLFWESLGLQDAGDFQNLTDLSNEPYVQDAESLIDWILTTSPTSSTRPVRALYHPMELYTSDPNAKLFTNFITQWKNRLAANTSELQHTLAKQAWSDHAAEYRTAPALTMFSPMTKPLALLKHLKQAFTKPFVNACLDIGLYHGIVNDTGQFICHLPDALDAFAKQNLFQPYFIDWLKKSWGNLQQIRHQLHQVESLSRHDWQSLHKELTVIQESVLQPLWSMGDALFNQTHSLFDPIDPWFQAYCLHSLSADAALTEEFARTLTVWLKSRVAMNASLENYQAVYEKLSDEGQAFFLSEGRQVGIANSLPETLATLARPNGYRQSTRLEQQHLSTLIAGLVATREAATSAQELLHCATCDSHPSPLPFAAEYYAHLTASVQLLDEITPRELHPLVIRHLLDPKTGRILENPLHPNLQALVSHRHRGVALVFQQGLHIYAIYIKEKPDHPLMDYAIYTLRQRSFGHGAPPNQLAKLTVVNRHPHHSYCYSYPVLISTWVNGPTENLKTYLEQATTRPLNLSLRHFFESALFDAVAHPGDGSARNYHVSLLKNSEHCLVCVDNDQYFVKPFLDKKLQLRSILFCFPEMEQRDEAPLRVALNAFIQLDIKALLKAWLQELIQYERASLRLFSQEERKEHFQNGKASAFVTLHLLFPEGMVFRLGTDLCNLQAHAHSALASQQWPCAFELLESVQDFIAHCYQQELAKKTISPLARFNSITNAALVSNSSSQSLQASLGKAPTLQEVEHAHKYSPLNALEELALLEVLSIQQHTRVSASAKETHLIMDFKKYLLTVEKQKILLQLQLQRRYTHIAISHCQALDDKLLKALLMPSNNTLIYLRLHSCSRLTSANVEAIADTCPQLKKLSLINNAQLVSFKKIAFYPRFFQQQNEKLHFPQLIHLNLSYNPQLIEIKLAAPELQTLKIKSCPQLKLANTQLITPQLRILIPKTPKWLAMVPSNPLLATPNELCEYSFKITAVGTCYEYSCGKTVLLRRYVDGKFSDKVRCPIGVEFYMKKFYFGQNWVNLQIWDVADQERFGKLARVYYKETAVFLVFFSSDRRSSLEEAVKWAAEVKESDDVAPLLLIMTESHLNLSNKKEIHQQALALARKIGAVKFIECSAKTGENVNLVFEEALKLAWLEELKKEYPNHPVELLKSWIVEVMEKHPSPSYGNFESMAMAEQFLQQCPL